MIRAFSARRLGRILNASVPFDLTLFLMLLGLLPWHSAFTNGVKPSFVLASIYYWILHAPDLMPVWAIFLIGILHDFLGLSPLGAGLLTFLTAFGLSTILRRHLVQAPLPTNLGGFAMVIVFSRFIGWLAISYQAGAFLDLAPTFFLALLDLVSYLPLAYLFARIQQSLFPSR